MQPKANWLKIVGTGIRLGQATQESLNAIRGADRVFAAMADDFGLESLRALQPEIVDLSVFYGEGKDRRLTYEEMAQAVLEELRAGKNVCFALYGHPLVFAYPATLALKRAREEGYTANVLPGVSAEDCLYADLGFDPAAYGCQSYLATSLVRENRTWDPESVLVLWQVHTMGNTVLGNACDLDLRTLLCDRLQATYGAEHPAILYEAPSLPIFGPDIRRMSFKELGEANLRSCCTIVVPPLSHPDLVDASLFTPDREYLVMDVPGRGGLFEPPSREIPGPT